MPNFGMVGAGGAAGASQTLHDILAERYKAQLDQQEQDRQQQQLAIQQRSLGIQEETGRATRENLLHDNQTADANLKINQDAAAATAAKAARELTDQTQLRAYFVAQSHDPKWSPQAQAMFDGYSKGMPPSIQMSDFAEPKPPAPHYDTRTEPSKTGPEDVTRDLNERDPAKQVILRTKHYEKPAADAQDPNAPKITFSIERPDPATANTGDPRYGGLTPNSVWQGGISLALRGVMPPLGMGGTGPVGKKKDAVINMAAAMASAAGTTQAQLYSEWRGASAALGKIIDRAVTTSAAADYAKFSLQRAQQAYDENPTTSAAIVNRYAQVAANNLWDSPTLSKLEVYVYAAAREYAKVVTGSAGSIAGLSVAGEKIAGDLLNAAKAPESFAAAIKAMNDEMNGTQQNWVNQVNKQSNVLGRFLSIVTGREPDGGMDAAIGADTRPTITEAQIHQAAEKRRQLGNTQWTDEMERGRATDAKYRIIK